MLKSCIQCNCQNCYRWYKGPLCANCYRRNEYAINPEKYKKKVKEYRNNHPEMNKESCRRRYQKNREVHILAVKKWIEQHPEKVKQYRKFSTRNNAEKRKEYGKRHYRENKHLYRAKDAKYRTRKLNAIPPWADLRAIEAFYENCPKGYHVDHIIPLQGEAVCGLHVLENLQYLPAHENLSKGNKYVA